MVVPAVVMGGYDGGFGAKEQAKGRLGANGSVRIWAADMAGIMQTGRNQRMEADNKKPPLRGTGAWDTTCPEADEHFVRSGDDQKK